MSKCQKSAFFNMQSKLIEVGAGLLSVMFTVCDD